MNTCARIESRENSRADSLHRSSHCIRCAADARATRNAARESIAASVPRVEIDALYNHLLPHAHRGSRVYTHVSPANSLAECVFCRGRRRGVVAGFGYNPNTPPVERLSVTPRLTSHNEVHR